jgi:hypothetical protein
MIWRRAGRSGGCCRPVYLRRRRTNERNGTDYLMSDESSGFGSKWVRAPDLLAIYSRGRREVRAEADRWFQSAPHAWIETRLRERRRRYNRTGNFPP